MSFDFWRSTQISLRVLVAIIASVIAPARAAAQFPADHELRALLQSRIDEGRGVGIVLGLLEADGTTRVVFAGSAGEGARTLGPQTVFEIGSITKVFTGTLLADMVRRGEASLSDPVARSLPETVRVPSRAGTLSAPRAQNAVWSTFAPPTAAAMAILLVALWGRFRNRHRVSVAARDRR